MNSRPSKILHCPAQSRHPTCSPGGSASTVLQPPTERLVRPPIKRGEGTVSRRLHRKYAATYLGTSLSWLDKSRLRGDGPVFIQIGGRVVYDTADLDSYLASRRRQSTSEPR